jgi:hypothetical protein
MTGKKTGGRIAGTPNKLTSELRTALKEIIAGELDVLPQTFEQLPAKERLELLIKMLPYCLPKVDSINGNYDSKSLLMDWD